MCVTLYTFAIIRDQTLILISDNYIQRKYKMISKELLDILVCPETKAELVLDGNYLVSTDKNTRRRYRIEDDIPIMLVEESEQLSLEEWSQIMKRHGKKID